MSTNQASTEGNAWEKRIALQGSRVTLAPLQRDHLAGLQRAVQDGELWRLWYTTIPSPEGMAAEIERRLDLERGGSMMPFTILGTGAGEVLGMTSYMNIDRINRRVEIGSTWFAKRVQRTGVNTEAKLLMLRNAFEQMGCIAVEFRTHFLNRQSRGAIERLGAKLDGILRSHVISPNGALRDTCVYSIVAAEWPAIQAHLQELSKR